MKRVLIALAVAAGLSACATQPATAPGAIPVAQTPEQAQAAKVLKFVKAVNAQCPVVQPFLISLGQVPNITATQAQYVATASKYTAQACSDAAAFLAAPADVASVFNTANVQAALNLGVPALLNAVKNANNLTADQKSNASFAIIAAQLAIATALAEVQQ